MQDLQIWITTKEWLENGQSVVLAIVSESTGSSPGRQGFKLIISETDTKGTIGGGIMEHNIIQQARELIESQKLTPVLLELYHHRNASDEKQSGLHCSGSQIVIMNVLGSKDLPVVESMIESYNIERRVNLELRSNGMSLIENVPDERVFEFTDDRNYRYSEQLGNPYIAYILGAGHVGSAISNTLSTLDFKIIMIDHRESLPDIPRTYHEIHSIPYSLCHTIIKPGDRSFVLVVTSERNTDQEALLALRDRKFRYLGLMGSKTKIKSIFNNLKDKGVSLDFISQIKAPIGIGIPNHTPQEIGISVTAQIIKERYT